MQNISDDSAFESFSSEGQKHRHRHKHRCRRKHKRKSHRTSKIRKYISESMKCTVCLEVLILPVTLDCGHSMCMKCYHSLLARSMTNCPFCQQAMTLTLKENY